MIKVRFPLVGVILGVALLVPSISLAQVYRWVDEQGATHYSEGLDSVPERFRSKAQSLPYRATPRPPEPRTAPAQRPGATRIEFKPGAPILVSAKINGCGPVTLLLDTGADRTVISPLILWRLGISTWFAPRTEIRGATGTTHVDVVQVESIEIGDARAGPLFVLAHDVEMGSVDGLLGRDFLDQFTVNIDSAAGVVTLSPR